MAIIKMHCQKCGKEIPFCYTIQRMGCFCAECAGIDETKSTCKSFEGIKIKDYAWSSASCQVLVDYMEK